MLKMIKPVSAQIHTHTHTHKKRKEKKRGNFCLLNIALTLRCRHQNDSCISHFNVSLSLRDKVTRRCPQTTTFELKREPKQNRTEVLLFTTSRLTAWSNRLPNFGSYLCYRMTPICIWYPWDPMSACMCLIVTKDNLLVNLIACSGYTFTATSVDHS